MENEFTSSTLSMHMLCIFYLQMISYRAVFSAKWTSRRLRQRQSQHRLHHQKKLFMQVSAYKLIKHAFTYLIYFNSVINSEKTQNSAPTTPPTPPTPLNIDELINQLMTSVSLDKNGKMVVRDCLTDSALVEQIISRAIAAFKSVKTILELRAPLFIVGDLHG